MDFSHYVDDIIEKLKYSECYFEIDEKRIKKSINKYLCKIYREKVELAAFDYDMSEAQGELQDIDELKDTFVNIKNEMVSLVRELSKTDL